MNATKIYIEVKNVKNIFTCHAIENTECFY